MPRLGALLRRALARRTVDREAAERVKQWARLALQASDETALAVNEIACTDPACPGVETIVLVMAPRSKTQAYKVSKPLDTVTEEDIRDALGR
jgi:hypothetical protein